MITLEADRLAHFYFARMSRPIVARLSGSDLRYLDQHAKRYELPGGTIIYSHTEQGDACVVISGTEERD